jgi:uncharacterized protein involved in exopolysaccharide biosynthesis
VSTLFTQGRRKLILAVVFLGAGLAAGLLSKLMDKAYESETKLMIAKDDDRESLASMAGQLGNFASLLGGVGTGGRDVNEALATLRSRLLVTEFLDQNWRLKLVQDLLKTNPIDGDELDKRARAIEFFQKNVLTVAYDARSGLVSVSIVWKDRQIAADWANQYVQCANEVMRRRAIEEARSRVAFLRTAAEKAESVDLRSAIFGVLQAQVRAEMLATTRPEFGFRVFDPAVRARANAYVRPKSWLIALIAGVFASGFATGIFAWRDRRKV